jgi:hypothetical protein
MVEAMSGPVARCPWCSAPLPAEPAATCPACGATLRGGADADAPLPGVTTIDAEAILRARSQVARPRSRLLSFITGEVGEETGPADAASVKAPSDEVRREMLRLRRQAELAEIESEVALLEAQARLAGGAVGVPGVATTPDTTPDPAPTEHPVGGGDAPATTAPDADEPTADAALGADEPPVGRSSL